MRLAGSAASTAVAAHVRKETKLGTINGNGTGTGTGTVTFIVKYSTGTSGMWQDGLQIIDATS